MYYTGVDTPKSLPQAAAFYRVAAGRGSASAMNALALLLEEGRGVSRDYQEAARWYRRAVAAGSMHAALNLAALHVRGAGVEESPEVAAATFAKVRPSHPRRADASLALWLMRWHRRWRWEPRPSSWRARRHTRGRSGCGSRRHLARHPRARRLHRPVPRASRQRGGIRPAAVCWPPWPPW